MTPPDQLDNATVLEWAWSTSGFGSVSGEPIHGLAVCRYGTEDDFYRFACDSDWQVLQDQVYSSILEAKTELPEQYRIEAPSWVLSAYAALEVRGMTVNERLWFFGLLPEFDAAVESRSRSGIENVLRAAHLSEEQAVQTAASLLGG